MPATRASRLRIRRPYPLRRAFSATALLVALGVTLAGCGSSHSAGTSADPSSVVPAGAVIYAGGIVRPEGAEKTAALALARNFTHQADPYLRLVSLLRTPGSPALDYSRDIAPWLGPHAGMFLTSLAGAGPLIGNLEQTLVRGSTGGAFPFSRGGAQGAIVLDTSDPAKARSFLKRQAGSASAHAASYRGVAYELTTSGIAFGVVDRFAVLGSESGMHAVIDTAHGEAALAHAGGYAKLLALAPANALGHLYVDPAGVTSASAGGTGALPGMLALLAGAGQTDLSVVPSAGALTFDADSLSPASSTAGGLLSANPESARALGELPGESWLALGLGDLGPNLAEDVASLRSIPSAGGVLGGSSGSEAASTGTLGVKSLLEAMIEPLSALGASSAQARREFASWMGSAGVFASGSNLLELKAGIVISSKNPSLSRAAVAELAAQLRKAGGSVEPATIPGTEAAVGARLAGLPVVLDIADGRSASGQTKFVLGFGEASVEAALDPSSTMSAAATRGAAAAALGEGTQPSLILEVPTLLTLLEGVGLIEDPMIAKVVPYLRTITSVTGGGRRLNSEVSRFRLVLGVQQAGG